MNSLSIIRPDDWHVHFRDGQYLEDTVPATAKHFARALVMPNLDPAVTSIDSLLSYRKRILQALPSQASFEPMMTLYLNEHVLASDLERCRHFSFIMGAKLYPAGATTNSAEGVKSLSSLYPLIDLMQTEELVLQIHGETTRGDIFAREEDFIQEYLQPLIKNFPRLRIILEHISTKAAVEFVQDCGENVAATITPHHLFYNRNHLLAGGIKPHYYCLPILKTRDDQLALQAAAISGNPKFFAGTDSAPHAQSSKESACGCAGIYSAPYALAIYAEVFAALEQLNKLNNFLSRFGAEFYRQPLQTKQVELIHQAQIIPTHLSFGPEVVVPIAAGETLSWSINDSF